eukprot:1948538-Pyramimonas_sp.AAC.1
MSTGRSSLFTGLVFCSLFPTCNAASAGTTFRHVALTSGSWTRTFYVSEHVMLHYHGLISSGAVMFCYVNPWPRYNVGFP